MSASDPRVLDGMRAQLAGRDDALAGGANQLGWKLGFGTGASMRKFELGQPLVGYLLDSGLLDDGASVALRGWHRPVLEPEVAVHLGSDVEPGASYVDVRGAVAGLSVAIELADLHPQPDGPADVRAVLGGNIFHRHVLLGPLVTGRTSSSNLAAAVIVDGAEVAAIEDASSLTGELVELVSSTASQLGAVGERLVAGQVVITGSVVPPLTVAAGNRVEVQVAELGSLTLSFR